MRVSLPGSGRMLRNVRRDFAEWHKGRPWFVLWALDVDVPAVRHGFDAAQQALSPWLLEGYRRQPHVTLGLCGFPAPVRGGECDTWDPGDGWRQIQGLQALKPQSVMLEMGGAGSFTSAPYLAVRHERELDSVRAALGLNANLQHLEGYLPHVTLGLYRESWLPAQLHAGLAQVNRLPRVQLALHELRLLAYAAADIGGPLHTVARFDLRSRRLYWHPAALHVLGTDWLAALPAV